MAGNGPVPKDGGRRRRNPPARGEWKPTPNSGWQFSPYPDPPDVVGAQAAAVWHSWMRSWFAAHWTPDDLPGLTVVIGLYDLTLRWIREPVTVHESPRGRVTVIPNPNPTTELRQLMDNYGITPKGQQDRRWTRPEATPAAGNKPAKPAPKTADNPYGHLRVVNG